MRKGLVISLWLLATLTGSLWADTDESSYAPTDFSADYNIKPYRPPSLPDQGYPKWTPTYYNYHYTYGAMNFGAVDAMQSYRYMNYLAGLGRMNVSLMSKQLKFPSGPLFSHDYTQTKILPLTPVVYLNYPKQLDLTVATPLLKIEETPIISHIQFPTQEINLNSLKSPLYQDYLQRLQQISEKKSEVPPSRKSK